MTDLKLDISAFDTVLAADDPVVIDNAIKQYASSCVEVFKLLTGGKDAKKGEAILYHMDSPFRHVQISMNESRMIPILGLVLATQHRHNVDLIFLDKDLTRLDTEGTVRWVDAIRSFCRHIGLSYSSFAEHMAGNIWIGSETDVTKRLSFDKDTEHHYLNSVHQALALIVWIHSNGTPLKESE